MASYVYGQPGTWRTALTGHVGLAQARSCAGLLRGACDSAEAGSRPHRHALRPLGGRESVPHAAQMRQQKGQTDQPRRSFMV